MRKYLLAALAVLLASSVPLSLGLAKEFTPVQLFLENSGAVDLIAAENPCGFSYRQEWSETDHVTRFMNDLNKRVWAIHRMHTWVRHTNVDSGYFLTEDDTSNEVFHFDPPGSNNVTMDNYAGQIWRLRDPDGKIVYFSQGHYSYDAATDTVTMSHMFDPRFWEVICPLLSGGTVPPQ